jgi:hypothetical protein
MEAMAHGVRFHGYFKLPEGIFRHFHLISKARRASDCARWSPTVFTTEDFPQAPWLWQKLYQTPPALLLFGHYLLTQFPHVGNLLAH